MTTEQWKIIYKTLICLGIGALGFYLGRKTYNEPQTETKIEYVKGETIHEYTSYPVPYLVKFPADTADIIRKCVEDGIYYELFPERTKDTVIVVSDADTTAILRDWAAERAYSETLFDCDTLGKMVVNTNVQYNRIKNYSYDFTPNYKTVVEKNYTIKAFSPYVGVGVLVNPWDEKKDPMSKISAGFFIKEKVGIELDYQHGFSTKNDFLGGSILLKF